MKVKATLRSSVVCRIITFASDSTHTTIMIHVSQKPEERCHFACLTPSLDEPSIIAYIIAFPFDLRAAKLLGKSGDVRSSTLEGYCPRLMVEKEDMDDGRERLPVRTGLRLWGLVEVPKLGRRVPVLARREAVGDGPGDMMGRDADVDWAGVVLIRRPCIFAGSIDSSSSDGVVLVELSSSSLIPPRPILLLEGEG
jgi:hypothetical protein